MMAKTRILFLTIGLLAVLAACGGNLALDNVENEVDLEPEAGETAVVEGDDGEKGVDAAAPVIVYERSGGITGAVQTWEIYADGTVVAVHSDEEWQGDATGVATLLAMAASFQFGTLEAAYLPADTCCDRITYTLTITSDGESHTVSTMDEAGAPDELLALITVVEAFIRTAGG